MCGRCPYLVNAKSVGTGQHSRQTALGGGTKAVAGAILWVKRTGSPNLGNQLWNEAQTLPFGFVITSVKVLEGVERGFATFSFISRSF